MQFLFFKFIPCNCWHNNNCLSSIVYNNFSILPCNFSNNTQVVTFVSLVGSGFVSHYSTCSGFVFPPSPVSPIIDENI